jgi:hypothetical protein
VAHLKGEVMSKMEIAKAVEGVVSLSLSSVLNLYEVLPKKLSIGHKNHINFHLTILEDEIANAINDFVTEASVYRS